MNVLIDTNVVLDYLLRREHNYANALNIIALSETGKLTGFISASAVTDIFYIIRKEYKSRSIAIEQLKKLMRMVHAAAVSDNDIHEALELGWQDFEDAVQYVSGRNVMVEYIITRNAQDFGAADAEVVTPEEFLDKFII